jgi:retinol dehydrogenase 14
MGRVLVAELVASGYRMVLPCRDLDRAEALRLQVQLINPKAVLDFVRCDLADLASVARCARTILQRYPVIDLFIANAATVEITKSHSVQGIEKTFAVNHLAHFVLLSWLIPVLYVHSRAIFLSSSSAWRGRPEFALSVQDASTPYHYFQAYANSKLANIACARSFGRLLQDRQVACTSVDPGWVATPIWPEKTLVQRLLIPVLKRLYFMSPSEGARPVIHLALSLQHSESVGHFKRFDNVEPCPAVTSDFENRLWQLSVELANDFLPESNVIGTL